jgi:hypothetical protein
VGESSATPFTQTVAIPRSGSGTSGAGGRRRIRNVVGISSDARAVQAVHARSTRVDLAIVEGDLEQQRLLERGQRLAQMPGALGHDREVVVTGIRHGDLNVLDAPRDAGAGGPLIGVEVPRPAGGVVCV